MADRYCPVSHTVMMRLSFSVLHSNDHPAPIDRCIPQIAGPRLDPPGGDVLPIASVSHPGGRGAAQHLSATTTTPVVVCSPLSQSSVPVLEHETVKVALPWPDHRDVLSLWERVESRENI